MSGQPLGIGLLAHTRSQLYSLKALVEEAGQRVVTSITLDELPAANAAACASERADEQAIHAWLIAIDESSKGEASGELDDSPTHWLEEQQLFDRSGAVILFCDGSVPERHEPQYRSWARRLTEKLQQLKGAINLANTAEGCARQVWVLAASTGGPTAVKEFLAALPAGLGVGFVYVQHIDTGFRDTLAQALSRGTCYPAQLVEHGSVVRPNEVAIVSPSQATELLPNGTFLVKRQPWLAPYQPSADCMIANAAHAFGKRAGVIVFTGMGDDGAAGSRLMRQKGGRVWAQSPQSCTSDSMPCSAIKMGAVQFSGTPAELALRLVRELGSPAETGVAPAAAKAVPH